MEWDDLIVSNGGRLGYLNNHCVRFRVPLDQVWKSTSHTFLNVKPERITFGIFL